MGAFFWDYSGDSHSGLGITEYTEYQLPIVKNAYSENSTSGGGDLRTVVPVHARVAITGRI